MTAGPDHPDDPVLGIPTLVDLFAGCGGMTRGFVDAGFEPRLAIERDLAAAATYAANFGEDHVLWGDIEDVPAEAVPEADVVIGGPPCQGFSKLGSKDPLDPRNRLWRHYARIVRAVRPKVFVLENVDRFLTSEEFGLLRREIEHGRLSEYRDWTADVLCAADYGVAQKRRRTVLIASRVGPVDLPSPTHHRDDARLPPWPTVRDALGRVPLEPARLDLPNRFVEVFGERVPGLFGAMDIHLGRRPHAISLERYDHVPPGGNRFDLPTELLPPCWANKPTGTTDVMGRLRWDEPALTIRTEFFKPEKGRYLHPQWDPDPTKRVNRAITHYEAALLQGFPTDYQWCGGKLQIARQIGNAVPVPLARALATAVKTTLERAEARRTA